MWYTKLTLHIVWCGTEQNVLFLENRQENIHSIWNFFLFTLFSTQINIKSMLLQNGPHQNLGTRRFDKNVFQIFLHNIERKPLLLNCIDNSHISPLLQCIRNYYILLHNDVILHCDVIWNEVHRGILSYSSAD
jgi:hypothetical protein